MKTKLKKNILVATICTTLILGNTVPAFAVNDVVVVNANEKMQDNITHIGIEEGTSLSDSVTSDYVTSPDTITAPPVVPINIRYNVINENSKEVTIIGKTKASPNEDYKFFIRINASKNISRYNMSKVLYRIDGGEWLKPVNFSGEFTIPKDKITGEITISAPIYNTYSSWSELKDIYTYDSEANAVKTYYRDFGAMSKPYALLDPSILSMNYVTQGQTTSARNEMLFVGYYDNSIKGASIIQVIDMNTREMIKAVRVLNQDGTPSLSHMGGLIANNTNLWITSNNSVSKISIQDIVDAEDMGYVTIKEVTPLNIRASFGSYSNGMAWVGEYGYAQRGYTTDKTHILYPGDMGLRSKNEGLIIGYKLDENADVFSPVPEVVISIPQAVQGAAVGPNNEILFTCNDDYYPLGSEIYICDDYTKLLRASKVLEDGKEYTIHVFDKDKLSKIIPPIRTMTLTQNINFLPNGNMLINSEGSSNKYLHTGVQATHHIWEFNPMLTPDTTTQYKIKVKTANKAYAGTDADISIKLIGENGETEFLNMNPYTTSDFITDALDKDISFKNMFERNKTNEFTRTFDKNVGKIKAIELVTNGKGTNSNWLPEYIHIDPVCKGMPIDGGALFNLNQWINGEAAKLFTLGETTQFKITVKTGNLKNAGTDSNIFIKLQDKNKTSNEIKLNPLISGNAFERNDTDICNITFSNALDKLKAIELRSDMEWAAPGWYLEYIKVEPITNGLIDSSNTKTFIFKQWIDDKNIKIVNVQ